MTAWFLAALLWLADEPPWAEILAAEGRAPVPQAAVYWRDDLSAALSEARRSGRPLFVTLRCLPCKQCADFDVAVLEGSPELDLLLRQFVTVRLTDALQIDLNVLPALDHQDLDLSWWGYLLSDEAALYSVFGGRDEVSDTTRISIAALQQVLTRVLAHHYDRRRAGWGLDGAIPDPAQDARRADSLPGYHSWRRRSEEAAAQSCLHCHQIAEIQRQPALDAGQFDKHKDLTPWPLPENAGFAVDRDDGLRVTAITAGSAAERVGLKVGDQLVAAAGRRVFGQADVRGALHRGPGNDGGRLDLVWSRAGEIHAGTLELAAGWRHTELAWRMSVSQGNVGASPTFWPLAGPRAGAGRMSVKAFFGQRNRGPAWQAGLRPEHEILAVNGESPDLVARAFLVWFRQRHDPGDEVVLTVRDGDGSREIRYELPRP